MTETKAENKDVTIGPKTRLLDILISVGADGKTIARFSESHHISMREIRETWEDIPWDADKLSHRMDMDFDLVLKYPNSLWNWHGLSRFVKEKTVIAYPDLPWSYNRLSPNRNISMQFVASCCEKPWKWEHVSMYAVMSIEGMRALTKMGRIHFQEASRNKTLTIDIFLEYPDAEWNMTNVSCSPGITDADIARNPQIKWCNVGLCMRRNIPERLVGSIHKIVAPADIREFQLYVQPKYLLRNTDIPRDRTFLALNEQMTHGFVKLMTDVQWDEYDLVGNIGLRWSADSKKAITHGRRFTQRWTTSPYDVWRLVGGNIEEFVSLLEPYEGVWFDFGDVSTVMGRRIVKHLKPYTWITRRRRLEILMEIFAGVTGFPSGVVRLIARLL